MYEFVDLLGHRILGHRIRENFCVGRAQRFDHRDRAAAAR